MRAPPNLLYVQGFQNFCVGLGQGMHADVIHGHLTPVVQVGVQAFTFVKVLLAIVFLEIGMHGGFDLLPWLQTDNRVAGELEFTAAVGILHEIGSRGFLFLGTDTRVESAVYATGFPGMPITLA